MRKLVRDKVISIVHGKALVGVYWDGTDGSEILFKCSPEKADRIIAIFNEEDVGSPTTRKKQEEDDTDEEPGQWKR
jgi:hypothetical protein